MDDPRGSSPRQEATQHSTSIFIPSPTPSQRSSNTSSTASLVLVQGDEEENALLFPQFDDSDGEQEEYDYYIPVDQRPLSPSRVVLLLLAPSLRLGALILPSVASSRLAVSIPCLALAAALAVFVRHVWIMLAHYVRKVTVEDICCEAFIRVSAGRRWKSSVKGSVRAGSLLLRWLLVALYLRVCVSCISELTPVVNVAKPVLTVLLFIVLSVLGPSTALIASPRVTFLTLLSSIFYIIWLALVMHNKLRGGGAEGSTFPRLVGLSSVWDSLTCSLLIFAMFPPLSIYASLSTYRYPSSTIGGSKMKKRTSFGTLSIIATAIGFVMTLPLLLLKASNGELASWDQDFTNPAIQVFRSLILLFAIPETLSTLPRLPWFTSHSRWQLPPLLHSQIIPRSLFLGLCSIGPFFPTMVMPVLSSITLILSLVPIYILPAILHIVYHHLFKPTSIVVPSSHSRANLISSHHEDDEEVAGRLLAAKERTLQRRRLLRRLLWDVAVWLIVVGAVVWTVGKVSHWW